MHRNARDFSVLILYPATLLNSLMSSSSFLVVSLGFYMYSIMAVSLFFFFPQFGFLLFSSLIAVARNSKAMLNISGKSGHPCLVPDLRVNAFIFSPLTMMLSVGLFSVQSLSHIQLFATS